MKALLSQLRLDATLAWRGKFVHVTLAMALLFGLLIRFALPAELSHEPGEFVHDATGEFSALAREHFGPDHALDSPQAVRDAVAESSSGLGIVITAGGARPAATFHVQGHESQQLRNLMVTTTAAAFREGPPKHTVTTLGDKPAAVPFGQGLLPLLYGADTVLLGFLFAGVMVLQEKQYGTVRAYRVSPGSGALYVGSKLLVNTGLAMLGAVVMTGIALPAGLLNGPVLLLLLLAIVALTLFAIGLSVYFRSLSDFFWPLAGVAMLLSAPMVGYTLPSTGLDWLAWVPTHPVIFVSRELLFPAGRQALFGPAADLLLGWVVVFGAFALFSVQRKLMREAS